MAEQVGRLGPEPVEKSPVVRSAVTSASWCAGSREHRVRVDVVMVVGAKHGDHLDEPGYGIRGQDGAPVAAVHPLRLGDALTGGPDLGVHRAVTENPAPPRRQAQMVFLA